MTVRKPLLREQNVNTDALISKGALVREDRKPTKKHVVNLHIPSNMLESITEAMKDRVGISRMGWILEAIHEKIQRLKNE
jgi:hypothetical protein